MNRYRMSRGRNTASVVTPARMAARVRMVIAVVLVGALIAALATGLPAVSARNDTHDFIVRRMATECKTAYDVSQTLSLTASTNSYEKLARIRSNIYGMEMLNAAAAVLDGRMLLDENAFTGLYTLISDYNNQLITGMSTATNITDLQITLEALYDKVLLLN